MNTILVVKKYLKDRQIQKNKEVDYISLDNFLRSIKINLANFITFIRLGVGIVAILALMKRSVYMFFFYTFLFFILDFFDGLAARLKNETTVFGNIFDHTVDKLFVLILFLVIPAYFGMELNIVIIYLSSSIIISIYLSVIFFMNKNITIYNSGKSIMSMLIIIVDIFFTEYLDFKVDNNIRVVFGILMNTIILVFFFKPGFLKNIWYVLIPKRVRNE